VEDKDPSRVEVALVRTARSVRRSFNTRLSTIGLNMTEAALLSFVDEGGSLTQRELADRLHISRASAGTVIGQLEGRGLVERRADPLDRRVWLIVLTPSAYPLLESFRAIDVALRQDLRAGFDRSERQQLADLLDRLYENAETAVACSEPAR